MKNKQKIQKMVVLAILFALAIVLQSMATFMPYLSTYALPLGLISVAVAAVIYGPLYGALIGALWGAFINIFDPSCSAFYNWNVEKPALSIFCTILAVTGRGAVDGLFMGLIYKLIYKLLNKFVKINDGEIREVVVQTTSTTISTVLLCLFNVLIFWSCVGLMFTHKWVTVGQFFTLNLAIIVVVAVIAAPVISRVVIAANSILDTNLNSKEVSYDEQTETSSVFGDLNK